MKSTVTVIATPWRFAAASTSELRRIAVEQHHPRALVVGIAAQRLAELLLDDLRHLAL